jgi:hypothetical protein
MGRSSTVVQLFFFNYFLCHCSTTSTLGPQNRGRLPGLSRWNLRATKQKRFQNLRVTTRDLIHTQHHHNNHTTITHMSVGPSVWGPPSCEGLLCGCCVGDVNLTFSLRQWMICRYLFFGRDWGTILTQLHLQ